MIDKKKLKDAMEHKDTEPKPQVPTDPDLTIDVKNEEAEKQIDLYLKEKTGENLNKLIEILRTRRVLVPANLNEEQKPVPCLIQSPENGMFLPIYTSKEQIPQEPKSAAVVNMPFLAVNNMVFQQDEKVSGIVINAFTQNLIFKKALVEKIEEVEKKRKEAAAQPKKMQLTQEQYLLFERKQFEFGFLPKRFFEQGREMLDELCEKKEEYIDSFFEECYQQKRMYPYLPEDFSVMVMDMDSQLIVRVDLPTRDMGVPSCFRVYFAWNEEKQEGRYFTIERTQEPGKHLLGEFKKDWKHVDYGASPAEGAELQRVLDIIRQTAQ